MMKRIHGLCVALMVAVIVFGMGKTSYASQAKPSSIGFDTVILLDSSSSMRTSSDPKRIAIEASKLFVDMSEISDSNIALISFASDIGALKDFIYTGEASNREDLRSALDDVKYSGYTDIGLGLRAAAKLVANRLEAYPERKIIILFLSDGIIDIDPKSKRTADESWADRNAAMEYFVQHGIPVYAIGLNDGSDANREDLSELSRNTNGRMYLTDRTSDLPAMLNEIFATTTENQVVVLSQFESTGKFAEVEIPIPNSSILESNIIILSSKKVSDIELYSPEGEQADFSEDKYITSSSNTYSMVKIVRPDKGTWLLRVKGARNDQITVTLTNNYNLKAIAEVTPDLNSVTLNEIVHVVAHLESDANVPIDQYAYEGMSGVVHLLVEGSDDAEEFEMRFNPGALTMEADVPIGVPGKLQLWCELKSDLISRSSEPISFEVANRSPEVIEEVSYAFDIRADKDKLNIIDDLLSHFQDPDGDPLRFEIGSYKQDFIQLTQKGDTIQVELKKTGSTSVSLKIIDAHGAQTLATTRIRVTDRTLIIALIAGGSLLAAAATVVIYLVLKKHRDGVFRGQLMVSDLQTGGKEETLDCDMRPWGSRRVSIAQALLRENNQKFSRPSFQALMSEITFAPREKGEAVLVKWGTAKYTLHNMEALYLPSEQNPQFRLSYSLIDSGFGMQGSPFGGFGTNYGSTDFQ